MHLEAQIVAFLTVSVLVSYLASRARVPYVIAMVLAGLVISLLRVGPWMLSPFELEPDLILVAFLPGLLFEASYHVDLPLLRAYWRPILMLALPGVVLSTLLIGGLLHAAAGLPLADALVFGALISATDPIAVIALFRELGVDQRLTVIAEGESLLNDGVAIVMYGVFVSVAAGWSDFSLGDTITSFFVTVAGGVALGAAAGFLFSVLMARTDDPHLTLAMTTILAYGTYLLAEDALSSQVSPVIAVVVAGLVAGNYQFGGKPSAHSETTIAIFWQFIVFLINSAIFLLIGLEVELRELLNNVQAVGLAIAVVLVVRAVVVYLLRPVTNLIAPRVPRTWAHVIFWSGLRGGVSIALALSIPFAVESRSLIIAMAFGYVLFSLVVQGLTAPVLLRRLGLSRVGKAQREFEEALAALAAAQASLAAINQVQRDYLLPPLSAETLRRRYTNAVLQYEQAIHQMVLRDPGLVDSSAGAIQREIEFHQRSALTNLLRRGAISEEVYMEAMRAIAQVIHSDMRDQVFPAATEEPATGETE